MAATILKGINKVSHSAINLAYELAELDKAKAQNGLTQELHGTAVANNLIGGVNGITADVLEMVAGLTKLDE